MFRYFRHIRKSLIEDLPAGLAGNKIRTYLLYAVGEILLVVIGILIALQINNWNQNRIDRTNEEFYLVNLRNDLELQIEEFQRTIESELIIENFADDFIKNDIPFILIHDGIILPKDETETKMIELNLLSIKLFHLPVPIKTEML